MINTELWHISWGNRGETHLASLTVSYGIPESNLLSWAHLYNYIMEIDRFKGSNTQSDEVYQCMIMEDLDRERSNAYWLISISERLLNHIRSLGSSLHRWHLTVCTLAKSSSSIKKLIMKQSTEQKTAQSLLTEHFSLCSWHHAVSVMKSDCWYWLQRYRQRLLFLKLVPTLLFSPNFIPLILFFLHLNSDYFCPFCNFNEA